MKKRHKRITNKNDPLQIQLSFCTAAGDIHCFIREPTPGELQNLRKNRYQVISGTLQDCSVVARVSLFDSLFISVDNLPLLEKLNLGDGTGNNPLIPDKWKASVIFKTFETTEGFKLLKKLRNGKIDQYLKGKI